MVKASFITGRPCSGDYQDTNLFWRGILLALLLVTMTAAAADAPHAMAKTSIPKIARIGKIQIGYSTQEDLAKNWGEGKTLIGGHPNSARQWRVEGTSWILHTDGFEYSKRGMVVDSLEVYEDPKPSSDVPYARLSKSDFTWLGGVSPGMSRGKVMQILKRHSLRATPTHDGCQVSATGFYALNSIMIPLHHWTASLAFTNGSLSRLTLDASE